MHATFPGALPQNRTIGIALVASLILHAVLLWIFPSLREAQQRRDADPIQARLVEPPPKRVGEPVPPPAETAVPAPARLAPPKPAAPHPAPKHSPVPRTTVQAPVVAPPVVPRAETSTPAPAQTEAAEPASASTGVPAPSASLAAPAPGPASPAAETLDAGTLAQYRLAIMGAARRFKRYPRVALDQNWQGRVEIRMIVAASGQIAALTVRSSTGYTVLDEHALEMVERAKEMAPIPPTLRGKEFTLDIPVVFSLREAGG
jgi:protein TonB